MVLQSSPYIIPLVISIVVALTLALRSWGRDTAGARFFFVLMIGLAIWSLSALVEIVSVDLAIKILAAKATYIGIVTVLASWALFVFQQTGHERWIKPSVFAILSIDVIGTLALAWTNEWHHLIWTDIALIESGGLIVGAFGHGIAFWLHAAYAYVLLLFTSFLLIRWLWRADTLYRSQAIVMLLSIAAPWVGNILLLTGLTEVDLTPIGFTITGAFMAWGLLRFRLLDVVPIARETVIDNMGDALLVLDDQNRVLDFNKAGATILGAGKWVGTPLTQVLPAMASLVDQDGKHEVLLSQRHYEVQVSPVYDAAKRLRGRALLLHEITLRKQAAQRIEKQNAALEEANLALDVARMQAEEATRLKSQFLATMSHELRTPLTAIIGYTEIQMAGMAGELTPEQMSFQERILVNADHLLKLINEVLDLAKIEAGRTEVAKKPFTVQSWRDEVVQQIGGLAQQKGLAFEHTLDEQLPSELLGDAARLKQIAINLLSNAIKFTEKGSVKFDVCRQDAHTWAITVNDSGIGIPAHMQEIIFEEFRQVDNSSTRSYGGTGLGLAIVRKLVLSMGGNIQLSSHLGQGSTFTITLPLLEVRRESELEGITA